VSKPEYETDGKGNITTYPLVGWESCLFGEVGIVLAIHYAQTPEELETEDKYHRFQIVLSPQQSQKLGERLVDLAKQVHDLSLRKPMN
jgi:hypothetical protein